MLDYKIPQDRTRKQKEPKLFERLREYCSAYVSTYSQFHQIKTAGEIYSLLDQAKLADGYECLIENLDKQRKRKAA